MSFAILFHFLCDQHVSDINISIIRIFCWITTLVVLFLVRCVLEIRCGWVGVVSDVAGWSLNSRKLLMMDILTFEKWWAHKKWNKIASDIKLVFYSSRNQKCRIPNITYRIASSCVGLYSESGGLGLFQSFQSQYQSELNVWTRHW